MEVYILNIYNPEQKHWGVNLSHQNYLHFKLVVRNKVQLQNAKRSSKSRGPKTESEFYSKLYLNSNKLLKSAQRSDFHSHRPDLMIEKAKSALCKT